MITIFVPEYCVPVRLALYLYFIIHKDALPMHLFEYYTPTTVEDMECLSDIDISQSPT